MTAQRTRVLHLGCDVGTVSAKAALVSRDEDLLALVAADGFLSPFPSDALQGQGYFAALSPYRRLLGSPAEAVSQLIEDIRERLPEDAELTLALTGSGAKLAARRLGAPHFSEFKALATGISRAYPGVSAVLEMGGENSKFLRLDTGNGCGIVDYGSNGDCAAGTGSFLDQQATRLLYDVEQIGDVVAEAGRAAKIAGRCSVFAKSDMIHAQQKGATPPQVLKGLCEAVARNFKGNVAKGLEFSGRAAFVGGVAQNRGVEEAMRAVFSDDDLFVPQAPAFYAALGAALLSSQNGKGPQGTPNAAEEKFFHWPKLSTANVRFLGDSQPEPKPARGDVYLGVDIGSVSTNLVLIDPQGNLLDEIYLRTRARPIAAVQEGFDLLKARHGGDILVKGVGTTGSGRELIGELIGADSVHDEITAHKTGAFHVARALLDSDVDTIFEIGGQDAKFIRLKDGIVVDFTMNEACAAGTGSFLEEQAEKLGVSIIDEFAALAFSSDAPLRLGERCTVYMEMDLSHRIREGAAKPDVIAGLAYSVAQNYLNRVARGRPVGDRIFFQGGTAYNRAVAAAFAEVLQKPIVVPPHNGVMGAYGAALIARERQAALGAPSQFRGFDIGKVNYTVREFSCGSCSNRCDIQEFSVEGKKTYWGDKCSEKFRKETKIDRAPAAPDLFRLRAQALEADYFADFLSGARGENAARLAEAADRRARKRAQRPAVAMLRALYHFDRYPFWHTYLRALGCEVSLSSPTSKRTADAGVENAVSEPCFPVQAAHGHLKELADAEVDALLLPAQINAETDDLSVESHACPWAQTLPFVLGHSPAAGKARLLSPLVHFRLGQDFVERELWPVFKPWCADRAHHREAVALAYRAQEIFQEILSEAGREALKALERADGMALALLGRAYNVCDPGMNLNLPAKLRALYGIDVFPMDSLPSANLSVSELHPNMYWNYGRKILRAARFVAEHPRLHAIYLTNFKCGPDSFLKTFAVDVSPQKPFLTLQFDAHGNDAGMMTRCEAYLDSKGFLRWWNHPRAAH